MNTRQLEFFVTAAQARSIHRAASLCETQPSTVFSAIKELEKELIVPLYQKTPYGIELTKEGCLFYEAAEEIILKLHRFQQKIQFSQLNLCGEIQFAAIPGIMSYILPDFSLNLANQFFSLSIQYHTLPHKEILEQLNTDSLHLGYIHVSSEDLKQYQQQYPNLTFRPILECNYVYMASKKNPLAKKVTITEQELSSASLSIYVHNKIEDNPVLLNLPCKKIFFTNSEKSSTVMMFEHNYLTLVPYYNKKLVSHILDIYNNVLLFPKKPQTNYITAVYAKHSSKITLIEQLLYLQQISNKAISVDRFSH